MTRLEIQHPPQEIIDSRHFYAAYIFAEAATHQQDTNAILQQAQQLGYPVRYWWLSEAMDIGEAPDRLIICIHHPANDENAGMDLYEALTRQGIHWDDLDAAALDEYAYLGKPITKMGSILQPDNTALFPTASEVAQESDPVPDSFALDQFQIPLADVDKADAQPSIRQLIGWPECYEENGLGHICNAILAYEGWGKDGQLYIRREWSLSDESPDSFVAHDWQPEFTVTQGWLLQSIFQHIGSLVENKLLSSEEGVLCVAFYRTMLTQESRPDDLE